VIETQTTQCDVQASLEEDLLRLRAHLEESDIEGARAFVLELQQRWPDSDRVQHFVRVLAPPVVTARPDTRIRRLDSEYAWLREHAREYPGCWLAVLADRLVAVDRDLKIVLAAVRRAPDTAEALIHFQPETLR
jgi:hypothetical protein